MFVCDGEVALQKRAMAVLGPLGSTLYVILNLFHVLEYLWKAASAFHPEGGSKEAQQWVREHLLCLLQGRVSRVTTVSQGILGDVFQFRERTQLSLPPGCPPARA